MSMLKALATTTFVGLAVVTVSACAVDGTGADPAGGATETVADEADQGNETSAINSCVSVAKARGAIAGRYHKHIDPRWCHRVSCGTVQCSWPTSLYCRQNVRAKGKLCHYPADCTNYLNWWTFQNLGKSCVQ